MYTHILRTGVVLLALFAVLPCLAGSGYNLSNYIGMTSQQLSAKYRASPQARAWTRTNVQQKGRSYECITWSFSNDPSKRLRFMLQSGRVQGVIVVTSADLFESIEDDLNRHLTATSDHEWNDEPGQTSWQILRQGDFLTLMCTSWKTR